VTRSRRESAIRIAMEDDDFLSMNRNRWSIIELTSVEPHHSRRFDILRLGDKGGVYTRILGFVRKYNDMNLSVINVVDIFRCVVSSAHEPVNRWNFCVVVVTMPS
jgi:hypothetical protein